MVYLAGVEYPILSSKKPLVPKRPIITIFLLPQHGKNFFLQNISSHSMYRIDKLTKDYCGSSVFLVKDPGILLPKLFWPTVRKNFSSDREKLLKFEAEGREFGKFLRSQEHFIQTVKGQNNFW